MNEKTKNVLALAGEITGGIVFTLFAVAFIALCCAVSGYHFE